MPQLVPIVMGSVPMPFESVGSGVLPNGVQKASSLWFMIASYISEAQQEAGGGDKCVEGRRTLAEPSDKGGVGV